MYSDHPIFLNEKLDIASDTRDCFCLVGGFENFTQYRV